MEALDKTEKRRLQEQQRLDALKSAVERNRWGQFATPAALALDITRFAHQRFRREKVRFIDPAIGTGSFYSALAQVFPWDRIESAAGVELDTRFANAARRLWGRHRLKVIPHDFTKLSPPREEDRYNLILTNPPYVRHHHLTRENKSRLRRAVLEQLGIHVSGLAGFYVYFLLLSHSWLAKRGLAIWLIPSEFMDVNYGNAVKEYLTSCVTLLQVHRFCPSDVQFSDALVSSAIVAFRNTAPSSNHKAIFSFGGPMTAPDLSDHVSLEQLRDTRKWTRLPLATGASQPADFQTLADLFNIKRGLATGANEFFILPRVRAHDLGIPRRFLRPILPSPRYVRAPIVETDPEGYPVVEPQLAVIDCGLPESEVREKHPELWTYLEMGKHEGIDKGYLTSRRTPWYSQERRDAAPFLCTYMGRVNNANRPFRFIWNKSNAVAANVYLMVYPKAFMKEALDQDPSLYPAVFDVLRRIVTETFLGEGRVYGGGLYKLEPRELGRLSAAPILEAVRVSVPQQMSLFT